MTLGRISPNRMYGVCSLRSRAADTYSSSRSVSTAARTVREMIGANRMPIVMISVVFDGPAEHVVDRPDEVAGHEPQRGSDDGGEDRGQRRDDQDVLRADDHAREDVPAELVGSEPVVGRRGEQVVDRVRGERVFRDEQLTEERAQHPEADD